MKKAKTRAQKIEHAIRKLWSKIDTNPFVLIAIYTLQESRERHNGWLYEDELPEDYDYDANFFSSQIRDGVRMFPKSNST